MRIVAASVGLCLVLFLLFDIFRAIVLARRAQGEFRLTRFFYRFTWSAFTAVGRRIHSGARREAFLGVYGPLSLLLLFVAWAVGLIFAFGLMQWSVGARMHGTRQSLGGALYFSASNFLTVGTTEPPNAFSKFLMISDAALGLSFLALVIGYLPVFYQSFARRELRISLLDARAGSPPSAAVLIARQGRNPRKLEKQLTAWEEWAGDLLLDELAYPMLAYFRSQHSNQSWLSALVAITDASAFITVSARDELQHQAEVTFAMGRHALIDSARVLGVPPENADERLPQKDFRTLCNETANAGAPLHPNPSSERKLKELREMYEPYAKALERHLMMALPSWIPKEDQVDNWRKAAWNRSGDSFSVSDPFRRRRAR